METGVYAGVIYLTSEEQGMKEGKENGNYYILRGFIETTIAIHSSLRAHWR